MCVFWGLFKNSEITNSRNDLLPAVRLHCAIRPPNKNSIPGLQRIGASGELQSCKWNKKNLRKRSSRQWKPSIVWPKLSCCVAWKAVINASDECAASILPPDHAWSILLLHGGRHPYDYSPNPEGSFITIKHSATCRNSRPRVNTQPHRALMEIVIWSMSQ